MGDVFSDLAAAVGAADKVVELIEQQPGVPPQGSLQPGDFAGRVELEGVAFSYPARPEANVLNGLTLSIDPGEVSISFHLQPHVSVQGREASERMALRSVSTQERSALHFICDHLCLCEAMVVIFAVFQLFTDLLEDVCKATAFVASKS